MARIELNYIQGLVFDENEHRYFLNGRELSGVTSVITKQLFPNSFDGIPKKVLDASAAYGSHVHKILENWDKLWQKDEQSIELQDYRSICREHGLVHEASEYLITDFQNFASACDKVYRVSDDTVSIGDIKTVYGDLTKPANKEKLEKFRVQLSMYLYMFQLVNPQLKVKDLFILHLRCKERKNGTIDRIAKYIPIDPLPMSFCKALLEAEVKGEQFVMPTQTEQPTELEIDEALIRSLLQTKADVEEQLANIKAKLLSDMEALGETKFSTPTGLKIVRKLESVRKAFDLKSFTSMNPDFDLSPYMRESRISGSLSIAI
ncbi:MAG: hypothetical protein HUJ98_01545 [Bacteroidaceae bacterium]|nr:hypothetical protein [Bacteroidaceae bacterium]